MGPPHPPLSPVVSLLEHVLEGGVQQPVVALALAAGLPDGHLEEAVVQGQVVPHAVLPAFVILRVVREPGADEVVNAPQGQPLVGALPDGHCNQSHVGEGWLLRAAALRLPGLQRGRAGADVPELLLLLGRCLPPCVHASGSNVHVRSARGGGRWVGGGGADRGACRCARSSFISAGSHGVWES